MAELATATGRPKGTVAHHVGVLADPEHLAIRAAHLRHKVAQRALGQQPGPGGLARQRIDRHALAERFGVTVVMIGDDRRHRVDRDDFKPLKRNYYCGECGQVGCACDGLDRTEDNDDDA